LAPSALVEKSHWMTVAGLAKSSRATSAHSRLILRTVLLWAAKEMTLARAFSTTFFPLTKRAIQIHSSSSPKQKSPGRSAAPGPFEELGIDSVTGLFTNYSVRYLVAPLRYAKTSGSCFDLFGIERRVVRPAI